MADLTLDVLRCVTQNLPSNYALMIRQFDCDALEWFTVPVNLIGITDDNEVLFLHDPDGQPSPP
jgi:hypothetical protein